AGRGGRGGADGVGSGGQGRRGGGGDPGVPAAGAVEGDIAGNGGAVDRDGRRPVGGGAVGVAQPQRVAARRRRVHRPLHVSAGDVVDVGESDTGVAEVVGVERTASNCRC